MPCEFMENAVRTTGTVTGTRVFKRTAKYKGTYYSPIVTFTNAAGTEQTFTDVSEEPHGPRFPEGTQVEVWYAPEAPEKPQVADPGMHKPGTFLMEFGLVVMVMGGIMIYGLRKGHYDHM